MSYNPSIPQAADDLSVSQGQLLQNFGQLDTLFGIDHYKYSNMTSNQGFHNQVTTPGYVASPPTGLPPPTGATPIFYSFQQSANAGQLQFSRGPNNAVPTPLTRLQSPATPTAIGSGATINIFDFTGLTNASFIFEAYDTSSTPSLVLAIGFWNGANVGAVNLPVVSLLTAQTSGNFLQLKNVSGGAFNNVYWTLQFMRIA